MNGPDKLEHFITLGQEGLPVTHTIAYWVNSQVMKKMKCCEYDSWGLIHNTSFSS
jgi:hypothetical protein